MEWVQAYPQDKAPTLDQMDAFIGTPQWRDLNAYLQSTYQVQPKITYSRCSGQPGWNVKYQKGGKSLCTLYPLAGSFIALVVIGDKEKTEMEQLLPTFTEDIQAIYQGAGSLMGAVWMMIPVNGDAVLSDVKRLIALRRKPKAA